MSQLVLIGWRICKSCPIGPENAVSYGGMMGSDNTENLQEHPNTWQNFSDPDVNKHSMKTDQLDGVEQRVSDLPMSFIVNVVFLPLPGSLLRMSDSHSWVVFFSTLASADRINLPWFIPVLHSAVVRLTISIVAKNGLGYTAPWIIFLSCLVEPMNDLDLFVQTLGSAKPPEALLRFCGEPNSSNVCVATCSFNQEEMAHADLGMPNE